MLRRPPLLVLLAVVILLECALLAAVLTGLSPAREELAIRAGGDLQGGPVDRQINTGGLTARIQITPAVLGVNRLAIQLPGVDQSRGSTSQVIVRIPRLPAAAMTLELTAPPGGRKRQGLKPVYSSIRWAAPAISTARPRR